MNCGLRKLAFFLLSVVVMMGTLIAEINKVNEFYVLPHREAGLFSTFTTVVSFLDYYDKGSYAGFKIDFERQGFYYDESFGPNWWSYYFEPDFMGSPLGATIKVLEFNELANNATFFSLTRERIHELIEKYIHVKRHIKKKVNAFKNSHFKDSYVIGIHYRATDHIVESSIVPYEKVYEEIAKAIRAYILSSRELNWKIFVATDDANFLHHISQRFPGKVIFQDAIRSSNSEPVHMTLTHGYQKGEEALIDCLLLSNCHLFIKTASNLGDSALCFNPSLPFVQLNKFNDGDLRNNSHFYSDVR